jgi:hypothetical protein
MKLIDILLLNLFKSSSLCRIVPASSSFCIVSFLSCQTCVFLQLTFNKWFKIGFPFTIITVAIGMFFLASLLYYFHFYYRYGYRKLAWIHIVNNRHSTNPRTQRFFNHNSSVMSSTEPEYFVIRFSKLIHV